MKKFLFLLFAGILGFTACEGPMGPEGPPGRDAIKTEWWNFDCEIKPNMWTLIGNRNEIGSYYQCNFEVPELTQDIYLDGAIIAYYRYLNEKEVEVQSPLPFTLYDILVQNGIEYPYAMQFSYEVMPTVGTSPGIITFKLTFSDFLTEIVPPVNPVLFRLTLIY